MENFFINLVVLTIGVVVFMFGYNIVKSNIKEYKKSKDFGRKDIFIRPIKFHSASIKKMSH